MITRYTLTKAIWRTEALKLGYPIPNLSWERPCSFAVTMHAEICVRLMDRPVFFARKFLAADMHKGKCDMLFYEY